MRRFTVFLSAVTLTASALWPAVAQVPPIAPETGCSAAGAEAYELSEVVDGGTLRLADGEVVLLAGIDVPRGLEGEGAGTAAAARAQLERLAGGSGASLQLVAGGRDRHGRLLAQVFDGAGKLLQADMVAAGFARVRPYPDQVPCIEQLLELEQEARHAKKGLWRKDFAVFGANDPSLIGQKGLYVIVEGFVLSVGQGNRVDFLNFGRFWQRDFTVLVGAPVATRLAEAGLDTAALAERRVRVRGVVEERGGPTIRLNDFRELEILDDD
jgi:micrococcal nuclease